VPLRWPGPPPPATEPKLRKLVRNMVYVGVAGAASLHRHGDAETTVRKACLQKGEAAELNLTRCAAGYGVAAATLTKQDPYVVEPMNANEGKILIDGTLGRLGAMFAGVPWWPVPHHAVHFGRSKT